MGLPGCPDWMYHYRQLPLHLWQSGMLVNCCFSNPSHSLFFGTYLCLCLFLDLPCRFSFPPITFIWLGFSHGIAKGLRTQFRPSSKFLQHSVYSSFTIFHFWLLLPFCFHSVFFHCVFTIFILLWTIPLCIVLHFIYTIFRETFIGGNQKAGQAPLWSPAGSGSWDWWMSELFEPVLNDPKTAVMQSQDLPPSSNTSTWILQTFCNASGATGIFQVFDSWGIQACMSCTPWALFAGYWCDHLECCRWNIPSLWLPVHTAPNIRLSQTRLPSGYWPYILMCCFPRLGDRRFHLWDYQDLKPGITHFLQVSGWAVIQTSRHHNRYTVNKIDRMSRLNVPLPPIAIPPLTIGFAG